MADPETDRCDVYEAKKALYGLVVTGGNTLGVSQLVEAQLDRVAQCINRRLH